MKWVLPLSVSLPAPTQYAGNLGTSVNPCLAVSMRSLIRRDFGLKRSHLASSQAACSSVIWTNS